MTDLEMLMYWLHQQENQWGTVFCQRDGYGTNCDGPSDHTEQAKQLLPIIDIEELKRELDIV